MGAGRRGRVVAVDRLVEAAGRRGAGGCAAAPAPAALHSSRAAPPRPHPHPIPAAQELTTLVYAYARMHYRMPSALVRISNKASRHLDLLSPQDASLMMWGFAKLAFKPAPLLLDRLPLAVAGRLDDFKPQVRSALLLGIASKRSIERGRERERIGAAAP